MHFNNKISPQLTFLHYKCTSEVQQPGTENFVPNYINLATFGLEIVYCQAPIIYFNVYIGPHFTVDNIPVDAQPSIMTKS